MDLDRLAGRRAGAGRRDLDQDARDFRGRGPDAVHDLVRRRPRAPVGKLELDDADGVFAEFVGTLRLLADACVNRLESLGLEHALLGFGEEAVLFIERQIAAGVNDDLTVVRLDRRKEFDAIAELGVADLHHHEQQRGEAERRARPAQHESNRPHVRAICSGTLVVRMC